MSPSSILFLATLIKLMTPSHSREITFTLRFLQNSPFCHSRRDSERESGSKCLKDHIRPRMLLSGIEEFGDDKQFYKSLWRNMILPDRDGHFGIYGGKFVPETLMPALQELEEVYLKAKNDPAFKSELDYYLTKFVGRPTSLFFAERLTKQLKGAKIYLKREDLCHTGAHKINNTIGQALLTRRMGKRRIIAETG